jgi:hypothetical protein
MDLLLLGLWSQQAHYWLLLLLLLLTCLLLLLLLLLWLPLHVSDLLPANDRLHLLPACQPAAAALANRPSSPAPAAPAISMHTCWDARA